MRLLATDSQGTVLRANSAGELFQMAYTPYGFRLSASMPVNVPGFNGELPEPVTGHYILGNGYRVFNPVLKRFHSPDSLSPFGNGGLNAYAYCVGDPINHRDPTGHFPILDIFSMGGASTGIALSIAGVFATIASAGLFTPVGLLSVGAGLSGVASGAVTLNSPQSAAGEILGFISLGLGVLSLGAGIKGVASAPEKLKRTAPVTTKRSPASSLTGPRIDYLQPPTSEVKKVDDWLLRGNSPSGPPTPPSPPPQQHPVSRSSSSSSSFSSTSSDSERIGNAVRKALGSAAVPVVYKSGKQGMYYPTPR